MQHYKIDMPSWFPHIIIRLDAVFYALLVVLAVVIVVQVIIFIRDNLD